MNQPNSSSGENHGDRAKSGSKNPYRDSDPLLNRSELSEESYSDKNLRLEPLENEPVMAELASSTHQREWFKSSPVAAISGSEITGSAIAAKKESINGLAVEFQNMSAIGGAVGGFVLGVWSIICSLITYFGFINAIIAIVLGIYGLNSRRRGLASIGIVLGFIGLVMSMMEINEFLGKLFTSEEPV